ncbi:helix-turn-helix transcriptional regulator [Lachnospiraceae bacterium 45-P1]
MPKCCPRPANTAGKQSEPCKKSFSAVSGKGLFMSYDTLETGRRIQKLRREKGLTQEQLAERLNVSTVHLAKIETGKRGCSLDILIDFAAFFNASLDYLVLGKVSDSEVRARLDAVIQTLAALREDM